jgi:hypothetical protein
MFIVGVQPPDRWVAGRLNMKTEMVLDVGDGPAISGGHRLPDSSTISCRVAIHQRAIHRRLDGMGRTSSANR